MTVLKCTPQWVLFLAVKMIKSICLLVDQSSRCFLIIYFVMAQTQVVNLQQSINNRLQLLETILKSLKLEASRALTILARYKSQNQNDGVFSKTNIRDSSFKELQEYNHLISKQFCSRLDELRNSYLALKIEMEGIARRFKTKAEPSDNERISVISNTVKSFEAKFAEIWREQHFLVLNYKLDSAAKELQRWTAVMDSNKKMPETINQMVNSMFQ